MKLPSSFYLQQDVVSLGKALLGKALYTKIDGVKTGGIITETESYKGAEDRACHAYNNRRTKRTEVMFQKGGVCYVYLCYGIHCLLNVVTNVENIPHAILIRAIQPTCGLEKMLERRGKKKIDATLTNGPGSVAKALGVDLSFNGKSLSGQEIWIEEATPPPHILERPRIGVDYAGEDALLPWRFTAA